jgi:hypothetical protein
MCLSVRHTTHITGNSPRHPHCVPHTVRDEDAFGAFCPVELRHQKTLTPFRWPDAVCLPLSAIFTVCLVNAACGSHRNRASVTARQAARHRKQVVPGDLFPRRITAAITSTTTTTGDQVVCNNICHNRTYVASKPASALPCDFRG